MIPIPTEYTRAANRDMFVNLPDRIHTVSVSKLQEGEYALKCITDKEEETIAVRIEDGELHAKLNANHSVRTKMVKEYDEFKNVWVFFYRFLQLIASGASGYHKEEYIFLRKDFPSLFRNFDSDIHTLSFIGMNQSAKPVRLKYFQKDMAGSLTLKAEDGMIRCTDRRYPWGFAFHETSPTFEDYANAAAKIVACIRALEAKGTSSDEDAA